MSQTINPNPLPLAMQDSLDAWLDGLYVLGYSEYSLISYDRAVTRFGRYLLDLGISEWQACQKIHFQRYFAYSRDVDEWHVNTAKTHLSALKNFFEYLNQTYHYPNISQTVKIHGKSDRLPRMVDIDVVFTLLDQAPPSTPKDQALWLRDKAMFELLYGSGLRVAELVYLNWVDLDLSAKLVTVLGKGNKLRQIPIGKKSVQALMAYLPIYQAWQKQDDAVFISQKGTRLTIRSVQLRLEIAAKRAGIDRQLHPHLLRHAFASHLLSSSGDLRAVQEMLGHSSLSSTQIYTHLDFASLAQLYDTTHPRAKLEGAT